MSHDKLLLFQLLLLTLISSTKMYLNIMKILGGKLNVLNLSTSSISVWHTTKMCWKINIIHKSNQKKS